MFKNYLKIALRNLLKNRFYTFLNVFGLSLGIGCAIILFQFITYHLSFDTYHSKARQIYRVVTDLHLADGSVEYSPGAPMALSQAIKMEMPQVKSQALLLKQHEFTVAVPQEGRTISKLFSEHENIAFADHDWFRLFDYKWIDGNENNALNEPNSAVLTKKTAQKYFGDENPVGKVIQLDNKYPVKITGVLEDYPANSDTRVDIFLSLSSFKNFYPDTEYRIRNDWWTLNSTTSLFVLLPENFSSKRFDEMIAGLTRAHMGDMASFYQFHLQPLKEIHFDKRYSGVISKSLLSTLALVGLFIIIIACVNFINMAIAQSAKRAKEIGTRKILGSSSGGIFFQFITETGYIILSAAILSIIWVTIFAPFLNRWLQISLNFNFIRDVNLLLFMLILLLFMILSGGVYPALILSRFKAINTLKGKIGAVTASWPRWILMGSQNVITQVLLVCTLVITLQIRYLKTSDLGFNKNAIIMIPVPGAEKTKLSYLNDQLRAAPYIKDISFCFRAPSSDRVDGGSISYDNHPWEKFTVRSRIGDVNYLKTFGLKLIAGRNLAESDTIKEFLVNEQLVDKLGIKDPEKIVGHRLVAGEFSDHPGTIVGVVKDFHIRSLYSAIEPCIITTKRDAYDYAAVKIDGADQSHILKDIRNKWQSVYPHNVFEYHFLDEQIADFYQKEELLNKLINSSAIIAIFISCLGLLGLISLLAFQRTKEIGVRKVLGASVPDIVGLLSKDFIKLVLIAIIIAFPVASWAMNQWLEDFAYRIEMQWWMYAVAGLAAICIALFTVSFQAIKAATANPVKSLRSE